MCCLLLAGCTKPVTRQVGEGQVAFACELLDAVGRHAEHDPAFAGGKRARFVRSETGSVRTESEPLTYETMADYDMPMLTAV